MSFCPLPAVRDDLLFFAEDAFGNQFCIQNDAIATFDAETGAAEPLCRTIEEWAERVLSDFAYLTGYPLLHEWQATNGALENDTSLVPRIPFVLGGEYDLSNLVQMDAASGMRSRGNLARQIEDLPEGARIEFRIVN